MSRRESQPITQGSVSAWIAGLKRGDLEPLERLWKRYADRISAEAEKRLPSRAVTTDGEDVTQSVFVAVWRAANSGRLERLEGRDDLWWYLLAITRRKIVSRIRHETALKRGAGTVDNESSMYAGPSSGLAFRLDHLMDASADPDVFVEMEEQYAYLLGLIPDEVGRRVAHARIEGYEVSEIGETLGVSKRTVERKLNRIRGRWAAYLDSPLQ